MATNIQARYGSFSSLTITLASLANDSTNLLAGRQSTVVANGSNLWIDYLITGKITCGTSPTAGNTIEIWAFGSYDDAPNSVLYPDVLGASDAAVTFTSNNVKQVAVRPLSFITVDSATDRSYYFGPVSLATCFGFVPIHWGVVVINGSGVALNSSAGNHYINFVPVGSQLV